MLFELLSELMQTSWGQIAVIGTVASVFLVWLLWAWESTVIGSKERVTYDRDLPPRPYVKVKSFRTFEKPFQVPNLNEQGGWDMWCDVEWAIRGAFCNLVTMIRETVSDFVSWSKTNKMFYVGVAGFAGTYYGGMFLLTNPTTLGALKSVGTAPYLLAALILAVVVWEFRNNKEVNDERNELSVEV
jgi:hypothetical protein